MNIIQVRDKGQVTIPKMIRQKVGVKDGAIMIVFIESGRIILERAGITPYPIREYTDQEIEQFIKDDQLNDAQRAKVNKLLAQ